MLGMFALPSKMDSDVWRALSTTSKESGLRPEVTNDCYLLELKEPSKLDMNMKVLS